MMNKTQKSGFIKTVLVVIIGIVLLSSAGIDLRQTLGAALVKSNIVAVLEFSNELWEEYFYPGISRVYDSLVSLLSNISRSGSKYKIFEASGQ
jgi:hypothetical protein